MKPHNAKMTPHARLVHAFHRGTGCRLNASDVYLLVAFDDAVRMRGEADLNPDWERDP